MKQELGREVSSVRLLVARSNDVRSSFLLQVGSVPSTTAKLTDFHGPESQNTRCGLRKLNRKKNQPFHSPPQLRALREAFRIYLYFLSRQGSDAFARLAATYQAPASRQRARSLHGLVEDMVMICGKRHASPL